MSDRIAVNPSVHFGKPCVAGTRIPIVDVLELLSQGLSFERITQDYYPSLSKDDIEACIQHAIHVLNVEDLHVSTSS